VSLRYRLDFEDAVGRRGALRAVWAGRVSYRFEFRSGSSGPIVVDEDDIAAPRGVHFEVRAEGLWASILCETPGEHWSFGLEAFGLEYDDEDDASAGGYGNRLPVGFDLEWEAALGARADASGVEAALGARADASGVGAALGARADASGEGTVHGEVLVASERIELVGRGTFVVDGKRDGTRKP